MERSNRIYTVVNVRFTRFCWAVFGHYRNGMHTGEGWYYQTKAEAVRKRNSLKGAKWPRAK